MKKYEYIIQAFKGIVVNRTYSSLHGESHKITLTVPLTWFLDHALKNFFYRFSFSNPLIIDLEEILAQEDILMHLVWVMQISSCIAWRVEPIATYVECNLHNDIKYGSRVLKTLKLFCRRREARFQSFSGKISNDYLLITP